MFLTGCPAGLALNSQRSIWMYSKAYGAIPVLKNLIFMFSFCIYCFTFSVLFSACMLLHLKCLTCVLLEKALSSPRLINNILPVISFHQPHGSTLLILSFYSLPHSPVTQFLNTDIPSSGKKKKEKANCKLYFGQLGFLSPDLIRDTEQEHSVTLGPQSNRQLL